MEILQDRILELLGSKLEELDCFLVEIKISPSGNKIEVFIDKDTGVTIESCAQINRYLRFNLAEEGLALEAVFDVSSPGMDNPFRVERQYFKNVGKRVEVLLNSGDKIHGILKSYDGVILVLDEEFPPLKKHLKPTYKEIRFNMEDIKSTKKSISF